MRVAYLVNQYPSISHTFVRREIEGLERLGIEVEPFSVRPMDANALPDPKDKLEVERTHALLSGGAKGLLPAITRVAASRPERFARAQALTVRTGMRSD